jgi:hypothetical protein
MKKFHLSFEVILLLLVIFSHLFVALAPEGRLLNWFKTDDAFYYFKVAQNISEGRGVTFDGFNATNGFHPLWMAICVPIFTLARINLFLPLRVLVMVLALLNAFAGILLYRLFSKNLSKETGWLVAFFWMFTPAIHGLTTMLGMETGVNAVSIILFIYLISRFPADLKLDRKSWLKMFWLGLAALLVLFSRLDNIFLVLLAGVWLVFRNLSLRWQVLLDFCLILLVAVVSYYLRIQSTTNIINFLPFAYLLIGLSVIIKPLANYFSGAYDLASQESGVKTFVRNILFLSAASAIISILIIILFDGLNLFRGYSRAVLVLDWGLSLVLLSGKNLILRWLNQRLKSSRIEELSLKKNWKVWLQNAVAFFAPLGFGLGAYMLWNLSYAGSALPISGTIKRWWGLLPNTVYGFPNKTLAGVISGWFSASPNSGPWSLVTQPLEILAQWLNQLFSMRGNGTTITLIILWMALLGLVIWLVRRQWSWVQSTVDRFALLPLFAGCLFSVISYKATGYLHAKYWYWIAEMVFIVIAGGILLECVFCEIRKRKAAFDMTKAIALSSCVIIFALFALNLGQVFRWDLPEGDQHDYIGETLNIQNNTQPGSVIGLTGGGVTAYFIQDRTIVNLDGLINGKEYFEQLKKGNADQYFDSIHMQYVYGSPDMLLDSDPYRWVLEGHLIAIKQLGGSTLFSYQDPNGGGLNQIF